jgi:hypothetical protein
MNPPFSELISTFIIHKRLFMLHSSVLALFNISLYKVSELATCAIN